MDLLGEAPLEEGRDLRPLCRKAAMLWLAPSAKMNFSRSSMFVLPLARGCEREKSKSLIISQLPVHIAGFARAKQTGQTIQTH